MDEPDGQPACPECGEPISSQERQCPGCGLDLLSDDLDLSERSAPPMPELDELDNQPACPQCGEPISGHERHCPDCGLDFLDEDGGLSEDAVDAMLEDLDMSRESLGPRTEFYAPHTVRLVIGLAICIPMAPLTLFIAESVVSLPLWASAVVFGLGWIVPGYVLSGFRIPSLVVAAGLVLIGLTMAVTPIVIVAGRRLLGTESGAIGTFGSDAAAAQGVFMLVGLVVVGLGAIVYRTVMANRDRRIAQEEEPTE